MIVLEYLGLRKIAIVNGCQVKLAEPGTVICEFIGKSKLVISPRGKITGNHFTRLLNAVDEYFCQTGITPCYNNMMKVICDGS